MGAPFQFNVAKSDISHHFVSKDANLLIRRLSRVGQDVSLEGDQRFIPAAWLGPKLIADACVLQKDNVRWD